MITKAWEMMGVYRTRVDNPTDRQYHIVDIHGNTSIRRVVGGKTTVPMQCSCAKYRKLKMCEPNDRYLKRREIRIVSNVDPDDFIRSIMEENEIINKLIIQAFFTWLFQ